MNVKSFQQFLAIITETKKITTVLLAFNLFYWWAWLAPVVFAITKKGDKFILSNINIIICYNNLLAQ